MTVIPPSNKEGVRQQRAIRESSLKDPTSRNSYGQGTSPVFSPSALGAAGQGKPDRYRDNDVCLLRNELENTSQLSAGYWSRQMVVDELLLSWARFEAESRR